MVKRIVRLYSWLRIETCEMKDILCGRKIVLVLSSSTGGWLVCAVCPGHSAGWWRWFVSWGDFYCLFWWIQLIFEKKPNILRKCSVQFFKEQIWNLRELFAWQVTDLVRGRKDAGLKLEDCLHILLYLYSALDVRWSLIPEREKIPNFFQ